MAPQFQLQSLADITMAHSRVAIFQKKAECCFNVNHELFPSCLMTAVFSAGYFVSSATKLLEALRTSFQFSQTLAESLAQSYQGIMLAGGYPDFSVNSRAE